MCRNIRPKTQKQHIKISENEKKHLINVSNMLNSQDDNLKKIKNR